MNFGELLANKKILILGGVGILVFLVILVLVISVAFRSAAPVTITYWGVWEPESVYATVIADYKKANPRVSVNYIKESPLNYRDRTESAIASTAGPDIFLMHNTWLPMFKAGVAAVPANIFSPGSFKSTFYPEATTDLTAGGVPYAIPLETDTLGLYINTDILTAAGVEVPTTWDQFRMAAQKMTVRDSNNRIKTAGAAVGVASNIDHWQDIVSLMMLQAGVDLNNAPNSDAASAALAYYTTLATVDKVWDETLDQSTLAFAEGKVGMYFGPSWRYFDIKQINPNLNFKVVPVPQLTGGATVNFASYWAAAVAKKSVNQQAAWDFLKFLESDAELTKLYAAEAKVRSFGEPYPKVSMGSLLVTDPVAGVFVSQAATAKSWYLASFTDDGDTGINSRIGKYYLDAVNAAVGKGGSGNLTTVAAGVSQVLGSYGVTK